MIAMAATMFTQKAAIRTGKLENADASIRKIKSERPLKIGVKSRTKDAKVPKSTNAIDSKGKRIENRTADAKSAETARDLVSEMNKSAPPKTSNEKRARAVADCHF
jgi:hypothetical protein